MIGEWMRLRERRRLQRRIARVLARAPRGGVPLDERVLRKVSSHLDVEWHACGLHPWDRDLSQERQAEFFAVQVLEDTVMVIKRLFDSLAEVDTIHICVLEPYQPHQLLLEGTVSRAAAQECLACPSPAMSLKLLGIRYRLSNGRFEPLA